MWWREKNQINVQIISAQCGAPIGMINIVREQGVDRDEESSSKVKTLERWRRVSYDSKEGMGIPGKGNIMIYVGATRRSALLKYSMYVCVCVCVW